MKYLQVMPTDETVWGFDSGLIIAISVVLIAVIALFDRSKVFLGWITKRKE